MFHVFDALALAPVLFWLGGKLHGPDAHHGFLIVFLLSGAIQYYRKSRLPDSFAWKYFIGFWSRLERSKTLRRALVGFAFAFSIVLVGTKAMAGRFPMFDQGIFTQLLWSLSHGLGFHSTIEAPGNHLLVHLSPTLALLAPLARLIGYHPLFLVVVSSLCLWGGGLAWLAMVRVHPGVPDAIRPRLGAVVTLMLVFFDSIWANLLWGFHEAHLAFFMLSWGYYFFLANRSILALFLFALTALTKEIYLLDMALVLIAMSAGRRKYAKLYLAVGLCFFGLFGFYRNWWGHSMNSLPFPLPNDYPLDLFKHQFGYFGVNGLAALLSEFVRDPIHVVRLWWLNSGSQGSIWLVVQVLAAVGFSPLLRKWGRSGQGSQFGLVALGLVPSGLAILLSSHKEVHDWGFHYVLILWPTLVFLSMGGWCRDYLKIKTLPAVVALIFCVWSGGLDYLKSAKQGLVDYGSRRTLMGLLSTIPESDSVWTDEVGHYVAARRVIQTPPYLHFFVNKCPDWIVVAEMDQEVRLKQISDNCPHQYKLSFLESGMVGLKRE